MKQSLCKRVCAVILMICLLAGLIPVCLPVEVEAVSGIDSLTCAGFISNPIARSYIDTMMRYHINSNTSLQNTLNNGLSVVFMFEGGSDNYWNGTTYGGYGTTRNQAVLIVVQKNASGNAYIPFYCENCSSIPDQPTQCTYNVGNSGSTTLMDGTYSFYTTNHTGPYGAFQVNVSRGYYTPTNYLNGQVLGASGINIHTRTTNIAYSGSGVWSAGCQLIDSGAYESNQFNQFMKVVAGINFNVWKDYYNKSFNTISYGITKGYYIVDRQLGMMDINGTQFGSGSLIQLYNSTALKNIAAASTTARNNAGFSLEYKDQCTKYPSHCELIVTQEDCQLRGQPCSEGTDEGSTLVDTLVKGTKVTGVGIYQNEYGNYWYAVKTPSGKEGYIYGGNVEYVDDIITDVVLTDATPPNGHVQGQAFYVNGTVKSSYNKLTDVTCSIYDGFGTDGTLIDSASDTPTTNSYVLKGSAVDNATNMSAPQVGPNTYIIQASYINYYAEGPTTLKSNTGTLTLMDEYYMVVPSAVDQSTCSHSNQTYVLSPSTCLQDGLNVIACVTCGKLTETVTSGGHSYGNWSRTLDPTCTETGVDSRTCSACGDVDTRSVDALGHSYSVTRHPATCQEYERYDYICSVCNHAYTMFADELMSQWQDTKPEGVNPGLIETKTQYRYSDYETLTSSSPTLEGYTQLSKEWVKSGSGSIEYVPSWPSGYLTTNSLYSKYNLAPKTATTGETTKVEIGSNKITAYLYYHWCYGTYTLGPINRTTSATNDGSHTTFHAFVGTTDPSTLTTASDTSVTLPNAECCTDSHWYYNTPIYTQTYTTYDAQFTYGRWTDYSDWSDTPVTASDTRKVETRTVYRYANAQLGDHSWVEGVCSVCGEACQHTYANGSCTVCGMAEPIKDYYLFGYINGANYGCEEDYATIGQYLFVDGQLVTTFDTDSYVAVKSGDNQHWYMTNGYLGNNVTSATLYDANTLESGEKLFVPGGVEITFTLAVNEDGTLTLGYQVTAVPLNPKVSPKYPSLAFEDEVFIDVYFATTDMDGVPLTSMGLVSWSTARADGTIQNAEQISTGATYDSVSGLYVVRTSGIPAKQIGDTVYFKVFALLADGSYIYSTLLSYSPKTYAANTLGDAYANPALKSLVVAMLNYGAAAQTYFSYKPYSLANTGLTADQKALVTSYHSGMISAAGTVNSSKVGIFANTGGFSRKYPSVTFESAFCIDYFFTPSNTPSGSVKLYYWTQEAYDAATTLTPGNASGFIYMVNDGSGQYRASVTGIAAKDLDSTIYVTAGYGSNGSSYCTGVLPYSIGSYCLGHANGTGDMQPFAAATAVYGYYAERFFN